MTNTRRPSMADVGRLADVSAQTVSRYLNGSGYVGAPTRDRIEAAVSELGYRMNSVARNLRTSRTNTVGVMTMGPLNYGNASILTGLSEASRAIDYSLVITQLEMDPSDGHSVPEARRALDHLLSLRVDGIVMTTPFAASEEMLDHVWESVPFVTITDRPHQTDSASAFSYEAGLLAVRHLVSLGHTEVLHLAGPEGRIETEERVRAYRDVLVENGLKPLPFQYATEWTAAAGYELGLRLESPLTAVFAANDELAFGFMAALRERGLMAPGDYSIVGVDDVPDAAFFFPSLSTVRLDFTEVGRAAFELLHHRIQTGESRARRLITPELVARDSTGALPQRPVGGATA